MKPTVTPHALSREEIAGIVADFGRAARNAVDEGTVPMWEYVVRRANGYGLAFLHLTEPCLPGQLDDTPHGLAVRRCDAIAFGRSWIANPDLAERFAANAPLNEPDTASFYQGGGAGYIDYPTLNQ